MNKERLLLLLYPAGVPYRKPDGSDGSDEESNNHEWHVSFADGVTMNCTVEKTDEEFDFKMISHGDLNLFCEKVNSNFWRQTGNSTVWSSDGSVNYFVARSLLVFATVFKKYFPEVEEVEYENAATVSDFNHEYYRKLIEDGMNATDAYKKEIEDAHFRIKYYEKMGFDFGETFQEIVEAWLEYEYTEELSMENPDGLPFDGNLLAISKTIEENFELRIVKCNKGDNPFVF